jgi:hypothetical protein
VRQTLESVLSYASGELERGLQATLNDYESQLFRFAEQARSHEVQARWLEAQRLVKRTRPDLVPRYMIAFEAALAGVRDPAPTSRLRIAGEALALVEDIELDENTVMAEMASRAELRNSLALYLLGQRFGVLAGKPAMDPEALPIGPQAMCRMMREASKCLELSNEHRLLLFRNFDKQVMGAYGELIEQLNASLARGGILPNLQYVPLRVRRAGGQSSPAAAANRQEPAQEAQGQPAATASTSAQPSRAGRAQPFSLNSLQGSFFYTGEGGGQAQPATEGPAASGAEGTLDYAEEGFQMLRRLLDGRRQLLGKLNPGRGFETAAAGQSVGTPALQGALDQLQRRKPAPMVVDGKPAHRSIGHIKQDMLALLRMVAPDNAAPQLADEDNDTLDLIGMLFDNLLKDVKPNSPAARLLSKLEVPLVRVALQDKQFFTQDLHPARQMLNAVAETGVFWINDDEADPTLVEKMNAVVDRTVHDFDGNLDLFRDLLDDIGTHLHTISRKAEVAERRHVEAARGKEKLAVAREHAAQAVESLLKTHNLPRFTHTLLSQAWTDVMALTALRHGEDSPLWQQQTEIAQRLVAAAGPQGKPISRDEADELRQEIDSALNQVGYHAEEASAIAARLVDPGTGNEDDAASRTELTMRLKARGRLGADMQASQAASQELDAEQQARLEQVKQLPFGTWFESEDAKTGKKVRRRLSWFSTVTHHVLFVNQRGQKVGETTLQQLAIDLAAGRIAQVAAEKGSLIDRAWSSVLNALRSFTGQGGAGKA